MTTTQHLTELETSGLIRLAALQPELEYLFRHALVQDAAYTSILKADRRRLHQAVGETVEIACADRLDELAPVLARHFDEAGDEARALRYYTRAADGAAAAYANAEAEMHYARALDLARPAAPSETLIHLYTARGRCLELNARYDQALANYADMLAGARTRGDQRMELAALMAQTTIHSAPTARYDPAQAAALSERARALARELNDGAAEAKVLWQLMLVNRFTGNFKLSLECGEQAQVLARRLDLREQLAFILNDMMYVYPAQGRSAYARQVSAEAQALWRELGNQPMLADSLSGASGLALMWGEFDRALALAAEARRLSESIGNLWGQSHSRFYIGMAHLERGDYAAAITTMEECMELGERAGFVVPQVDTQSYLALAYGLAGAFAHAHELSQRAFDQARRYLPLFTANPLIVRATLYILQGQLAEAEQSLAEARALVDITDPAGYEALLLMQIAEAELGLLRGDFAGVVVHTERGLAELDRFEARFYRGWLLLCRGRALRALGRREEAAAALEAGREIAESLGGRNTLWRILAALSDLAAERGATTEAAALRAQARELIAYIAEHCPPAMRDTYRALPEVHALFAAA